MKRISVTVCYFLLSSFSLSGQQSCPCAEEVDLFFVLEPPFNRLKPSGGTWDVWPDGTYPDVRLILKPSSQGFDCTGDDCEQICPLFFAPVSLPRDEDGNKRVSLNLFASDGIPKSIAFPACDLGGSSGSLYCNEVSEGVAFENVRLPPGPFHLFAVDLDSFGFHDLIFEHAKPLFREKLASENFENTSASAACDLRSGSGKNSHISSCDLVVMGRKIGSVYVVKRKDAILSYRRGSTPEPLQLIRNSLKESLFKWDYSYDIGARFQIIDGKSGDFFDQFLARFNEEQKQAAKNCDVREIYRVALKYSVKAGPLGFYDPSVGVKNRLVEVSSDILRDRINELAGIYDWVMSPIVEAVVGESPPPAGAAGPSVSDSVAVMQAALDGLVERDFTEAIMKVNTPDEIVETLDRLDDMLGGALAESWDYRSTQLRSQLMGNKVAVATELQRRWRNSALRHTALQRVHVKIRNGIGVLDSKVLAPINMAAALLNGFGRAYFPPGFFSEDYQSRRLSFLGSVRANTGLRMSEIGFARSSVWGDVLKDFQGGLQATTVKERCQMLGYQPDICAFLAPNEPNAVLPKSALVAPAGNDLNGRSAIPSNGAPSNGAPASPIQDALRRCVAGGISLARCQELFPGKQ
jgi:hypothetical protein